MKEPSQANTTIFYHNPTIDSDYGKIYPSVHSSINAGCVATGINFNDTICFFSEIGLEAITGDVTTEQVITHISTYIDNKLLNEKNYKNLILAEYLGYLFIIIDNHIYLADSRARSTINGRNEFEYYYWELDKNITNVLVDDGVLYLCTNNEIYTLTNESEDREIEAHWCTRCDEMNYPSYQKTTNKRGLTIDCEGNSIDVLVKADNNTYEKIGTFKATKGYIVPRVKKKKWKSLSLKVSSKKPFKLYSFTLECFIGNYIKRS